MTKKEHSDNGEEKHPHERWSLLRKIGETAITAFVTTAVGLIVPHIMGPAQAPIPPPPIVIIMPDNSQSPNDEQRIRPQSQTHSDVPASSPPMKTFSLTMFGEDGNTLDQFDFLAAESHFGPSKIVDWNPNVKTANAENVNGHFSLSYQEHPSAPEYAINADKDHVYNALAALPEMDEVKIEQSFGQVKAVKIAPKEGSVPPPAGPAGTNNT